MMLDIISIPQLFTLLSNGIGKCSLWNM